MLSLVFSLLWTAAWWFLAWSHVPLLSEYSFFPLWLGYIFVLNAMAEVLFKDSLMRRMGLWFVWLFVISVPLWWGFEYLNSIVQNWHYLFAYPISQLHFAIQGSIDFSTVIPAVLSATFLLQRLLDAQSLTTKGVKINHTHLIVSVVLGVLSLLIMPFFPNETFPLVWLAPLLIIDPINYKLGLPSIFGYIEKGEWLVPISTMLATLFTGFFWEMWNFWSMPKWYYIVPYVGFWKVFEMPILGYGGYLTFGLIVLVYSLLVTRIFLGQKWQKLI